MPTLGCVAQDFRASVERSSTSTGAVQLLAFLISLEEDLLRGKRGQQLGSLSCDVKQTL